jgi:hypothetical protein
MTKKMNPDISRRKFLRDAGLIAGGAALGSAALLSACAGKTTTETVTVTGPGSTKTATVTGAGSTVSTTVTATGPATTKTATATATVTSTITAPASITAAPKFTVPNPCGFLAPISLKPLAPRPANLDKTPIYLIDITFSGSDRVAKVIYEWFQDNHPTWKVQVRTEKGSYSTADEAPLWEEIAANKGVVIVLVGH